MYLYRIRFSNELNRLPAFKMYLHFINKKCFSLTGVINVSNEFWETKLIKINFGLP
ncbi:hypothetical protein HanPSC8_Chr07g0287811 [Helianthus annuus]|nr:hypothetical protein HanPSC8_Chr07g0287811 [Helianthus annuus]